MKLREQERGRCAGQSSADGRSVSDLRLRGLVEPCLLLLLRQRGASYGYTLSEEVSLLSCCTREVSPSVVYRSLHHLEREGMVSARWDASVEGPSRRVYRLTEAGEQRLHQWAEQMRRLRLEIDQFIHTFEGLAGG